MKTIIAAVAALAALTGCATYPPAYYAAAPAQVQDPYQWHTVSVMPSGSTAQSGTWTEELPAQRSSSVAYASQPAYTTTYVSQPVYYAPAPVYYAPAPSYYYPPVSIGLDFVFSNRGYRGWGGRGGYRGGYHRR
jgi:hypothetical protein